MSEWLLAATAGAYLATAIDQGMRGNHGMAMVFVSYALANVGLIWSVR